MNIFITFEKSKLISWMPAIATKLKRTAPFSFRRRAGDEVKKSIKFPVSFLVPCGGVALTKRSGADGVNVKPLARRARALAFQTGNPLGKLKNTGMKPRISGLHTLPPGLGFGRAGGLLFCLDFLLLFHQGKSKKEFFLCPFFCRKKGPKTHHG